MQAPTETISPIQALAHLAPDLFASLSDLERLLIPYLYVLWRRPEQLLSRTDWRYLVMICGRGWGKSFAIATEINRRVESGEIAAREGAIGLIAPTEDRVEEVQIKFLIETAPPWFKPERYLGGLRWPNGTTAEVYTAQAPERSRSGNFDLVWCTEIIDWQHTTRMAAFKTITTACRTGRAQVICDTTSKGRNDVVQHLMQLNAEDPGVYPLLRGTTFDNPLLTQKYLKAECRKYVGQEFGEEILGLVYDEAAGASWHQQWIDDARVEERPARFVRRLVAIDPALVSNANADETGYMVGEDDFNGDAFLTEDRSGRMTPEEWGDKAVSDCVDGGAAGIVIETNHMGDQAFFTIKSRAEKRDKQLQVRRIPNDGKPFPKAIRGVIYVREKFSRTDKQARASGPASETEAGRVHHVGVFAELEDQMTTYIQGVGRSPNRYDAAAFLITELRNLAEEAPRRPRAEAAVVAQAQRVLKGSLAAIGRGRTI